MSEIQSNAPPWINTAIQGKIDWRDQDIVISVPAKSGTTWTMNIVYQLLNSGDPDFERVYSEVPWIEFLSRPGQGEQEILDLVASMPKDKARAFKTHSAPPEIPYIETGSGKNVRYIVICRNPEEALTSFKPFMEKHTDAWYQLWDMPKAAMTRESFTDFYYEIIDKMGMQGMFFGFLAAWWPYRHKSNVLFLHYADMKKDHETSLRKIADFLAIYPDDKAWQDILTYTGFEWMKAHAEKFEPTVDGTVSVLESGAMIRKGQIGTAREDGMNEEISRHLYAAGKVICPDQDALDWLYKGGEIK
tara:strand:+ start:2361 stop:3269 length:909 start_codon:yes stop_codon:yes gene_type:complete